MVKPDPIRTSVSRLPDSDSLNNHGTLNNASGEECSKTQGVGQESDSERTARELLSASAQVKALEDHSKYRTGILTTVVVVLSLLLGWMVGRAGWNMAVSQAEKQSPEINQEMWSPKEMPQHPAPPRGEGLSNIVKQSYASPVSPPASGPTPASSTPKSNIASVQPAGALVIYERGKMVFQAAPSQATSQAGTSAGLAETEGPETTQSPATRLRDNNLIPVTNGYVITRIVPRYPEEARQQRVQGPVVLNVLVGADGSVLEIQVMSGDPRLALAATDAVRQWHFKPHSFKGKLTDFETHITVNFSLP